MKPTYQCCVEFTPGDEALFDVDDGLHLATYCPCCGNMQTIDFANNRSYWENHQEVKSLLQEKINHSQYTSHPISQDLFAQSANCVRKYEELLFNHLQSLEERYPEYDEFTYELMADSKSQWYNLYGLKK